MILLINSYTIEELAGAELQFDNCDPIPVDSFFNITCRSDGYRCHECDKLLSKPNEHGIIAGNIKCGRCKTINSI